MASALRTGVAGACLLAAVVARAEPDVHEPHRLPDAELVALDGIVRQQALALVESRPNGRLQQVTLVVFVRAPAGAVHDLVRDVGGYLRFVPNLKQADLKREADGRLINTWRLELPISSFSGRDEYLVEPGPTAPISFRSLESLSTYVWRFLPVPGGTLLVQAGYADVLHSNRFVRAFVHRQPALEHGLALAAQYMLVSAVQKEAERRAAAPVASVPRADGAALNRLAGRGQVVLMRALPDGKLAEVSAIERVYAPERRVHEVLAEPGRYKEFIAGVDASTVIERSADEMTYALDMAIPIVTWSTRYRLRVEPHSVEGAGIEGDLRGAHFRWDLSARGTNETSVVYRVNQPLARGNVLVKKLFEVDPSLEHGLNVAFALLLVRSVRGRAEGWPTK